MFLRAVPEKGACDHPCPRRARESGEVEEKLVNFLFPGKGILQMEGPFPRTREALQIWGRTTPGGGEGGVRIDPTEGGERRTRKKGPLIAFSFGQRETRGKKETGTCSKGGGPIVSILRKGGVYKNISKNGGQKKRGNQLAGKA